MGIIKTLLPLHCFHLPILPSSTTTSSSPSSDTVRLIASDGRVELFTRPIPASELMKQHPFHLICSSDSFFIGQKVPALSASDHLEPGHSYFILPSQFFHSVLSFVTLSTSLINRKDSSLPVVLRSFDIRKTEKGMLQVKVKDENMMFLEGEEEEEEKMRLRICTSEELEKEYRQLVGCCKMRQWKPRLETIREKKSRKRGTGVMLLIRRKMKKKNVD